MTSIRIAQNPGIAGLDELTASEELFVQNLAGLPYAQGDILYYNGTIITRLPAGTNGYFLKTQGPGANPTWAATAAAAGHTIQDEGTPLTTRTNLNFVGAAVTVTDGGAGPDSTIVTISASTATISFNRTFALMGA